MTKSSHPQLQAVPMTESYQDLLAQYELLKERVEAARLAEFEAARAEVRATIAAFGFTPDDLFVLPKVKKHYHIGKNRPPVAVKYRNPATGATWSGRGKPPRWMTNADNRSEFLV